MNCKLIKNIKASCVYNPGGISQIYLLDIRDFVACKFTDDKLYDKSFVDSVFRELDAEFISLESIDESRFTEEKSKGIYVQTLSTFVHTLSAEKLESLLLTEVNRYLVVFRTTQGTWFTFGSDGGATVSFTQSSGQVGEPGGYAVTISAKSVYPLFEASDDVLGFKYEEDYELDFVCELSVFEPDFNYNICETL